MCVFRSAHFQQRTSAGQIIGGRLEVARLVHRAAKAESVLTGKATPDETPLHCRVLKTLVNPWDIGGPAAADVKQQSHAAAEAEGQTLSRRKRGRSMGRDADAGRCGVPVVPQMPRPHAVAAV
jgi:hypothetical protein